MDNKVQQKLQDLFVIYTKNLPNKIHMITIQWQELLSHFDKIKFQHFHRDVHSLCGSSGTYGYIELSKAARKLEIYLKNLLNADALSGENKDQINTLLQEMSAVLSAPWPSKFPLFNATTAKETLENKYVYILEEEADLKKELMDSLSQAGYVPKSLPEINTLKMAVLSNPPSAIILNTVFLKKEGIDDILDMQKQQSLPIPLFCIVPDKNLIPRLEAIRAGCTAFFQKPVDVFDLTQILNQKCTLTGESYRILIIDDSESLAEYYSLILSQAGLVTHMISNPLDILPTMESFQPDLLLMDIYMPECTGLELAAVLRQESRYTKIPIIFLSTEEDKRKQLSAISLGGDDFLTKPIAPQHLISSVRSRAKRAGVLNYYMTTDSLTGILNHSSILKRLDIELNHAKQKKAPLSFIMVDIDHFKKINDTYGHPIGDIVIKKLSTLLLVRLRSQDIVGRYGGEEFAIILPGATSEKSREICNELREQFSLINFVGNNQSFSVSFSAGIASLQPGDDGHGIIEEADRALYKAKQLGRNQVVIFSADLLDEETKPAT